MLGSEKGRGVILRLAGIFAAALLSSCGGHTQSTLTAGSGLPPGAVPSLPHDAPAPPRHAAGQQTTINGNLIFDHSGGAPSGSTYVLTAPVGGFQWALYQFDFAADPLQSIAFDYTITQSGGHGSAFFGLSNYTTNTWQIAGPITTASETLPLTGATFNSAGNHFYFFILAYDGATVTINSSTVTVTVAGHSIGGQVKDASSLPLQNAILTLTPGGTTVKSDASGNYSFANVADGSYNVQVGLFGYTFSPSTHAVTVAGADMSGIDFQGSPALTDLFIAGTITDGTNPLNNVTVYLAFENKSTITDALGHYSFTGLTANIDRRVVPQLDTYSFNPPELFLNHASDLGGQDFVGTAHTMPATVTYDGQMKPWLFAGTCMNCHNSAYSGTQRNGAPASTNWDTYAGTTLSDKNLGNTYVHADFMPPAALGYKTTQFQKDLFQKWADGGFLEH